VTLRVEIPRELTEEQRRLIQRLGETLNGQDSEPSDDDKGWFGRLKDSIGGSE
jgi:DnaJ-class molecular chaperone